MPIITLTPEFLREQTPPAVHITKKFVIFNAAAAKKLALKIDDRFIINIDGEKLLISPSATKGFKINKAATCLQAPAAGLQEFLIKSFRLVPATLTPKVTSIIFEVGEFKEGANPLIYKNHQLKYKTIEPPS